MTYLPSQINVTAPRWGAKVWPHQPILSCLNCETFKLRLHCFIAALFHQLEVFYVMCSILFSQNAAWKTSGSCSALQKMFCALENVLFGILPHRIRLKKANAKHCHKTAASVWANSYIQTSKSVNAAHISLLWIILSANIKILAQRNKYWAFISYNVTLLSKYKSKDLNQWWLHRGWRRLLVSSCQSRPGKDCCSPGMMSSISGLEKQLLHGKFSSCFYDWNYG